MDGWTRWFSLLAILHGVWAAPTRSCDGTPNFEFASYYGSYMVLHRGPARATVWGYAQNVDDEVTVRMGTQTIVTTASEGPTVRPVWSVLLEAVEEDGPFNLTATSGECSRELEDVLFGDVWVCSGQSNMAHRLSNLDDPDPEVEDAVNYPKVRGMRAAQRHSTTPLFDLNGIDHVWQLPTQSNMASFSAICWLFGRNLNRKLGRPIGLVQSAWGGTRIEAWSSPEALEVCFPEGAPPGSNHNAASALWNAMIHPLLNATITGAIWYQGESNNGQHDKYTCAQSTMINDWRSNWRDRTGQTDDTFPFGVVQLAPWRDDDSRDTGFTDLRWAQTYNFGYAPNDQLQRVFIAIAIDLPDFGSPHGSIHPRYKRQIADRLSYAAYHVAYNDTSSGPYQGPFPTSLTRNGDDLTIEFDDGTANLNIRQNTGYELCCADDTANRCPADGTWTHATIQGGASGSSVTLTVPCSGGQHVTGLRYAWRESPCPLENCAVYGVENELPAPPYISHGLIG